MIEHPEHYIAQTAKLGVEIMCVHYEACIHLHRTIQEIHAAGMKAGVALNPSTPVSVLEDILDDLDLVLIMSVNPGFGGQKFIPNALKKVAQLRQEIDKRNLSTIIEVDGGVQGENAQALVDAGADALVSGSYIFNSPNPEETIRSLKQVKR
jgi:ribulose-phosphate 3-epimerase